MLVKPISAIPVTDSADPEWLVTLVTSVLDYGELAVALAASDMATKRIDLTAEERVAYAVQGLTRLGVATVQERTAQARNINLRMVDLADRHGGRWPTGHPVAVGLDKADRELWGGIRRKGRAHGVAYSIVSTRADWAIRL